MAGLFSRKKERNPADFWREYGERWGETVLAYTLGQYIRGWEAYAGPFWGLLIATSGGFRVHHFPHEGWIQALSRLTSGDEPPKEKTIFIPREQILSVELRVERLWWKRLFFPRPPVLAIRYQQDGTQAEFIAETDLGAEALVQALGFSRS
jgi:hypothetical protein